jgi:hypothetical protein
VSAQPTYDLLTYQRLLELPDPTFLIDGIAPDGLSVIFGKPGAYKSFVALDWCLCVATGHDWLGHAVERPGPSIYMSGEGRLGLKARVHAWWLAHDRPDLSNALFLPEAVNLLDRASVERLSRTLDSIGQRARLLTVDTAARSMVGGDENSARDMGLLIDAVTRTPADSQLVVHHTNRNGEHERGSTALEGAADLRVKARREGTSLRVTLTCEKCKDIEPWEPVALQAEHLHGSCVLSLVIDPATAASDSSRMENAVLAFIAANGPTTKRAVREGVTGSRNDKKDQALRALESRGLVKRSGDGLETCPEPPGTPGHAVDEAADEGVPAMEGESRRLSPWGRTPSLGVEMGHGRAGACASGVGLVAPSERAVDAELQEWLWGLSALPEDEAEARWKRREAEEAP